MMGSRFTFTGRLIVGLVVILFISAYMFSSTLMAVTGAAVLLYLAYRRMEFHSLTTRVDLRIERTVLEKVVHKDSPCSIKLQIESDESIRMIVSDRPPRTFIHSSGDISITGTVSPKKPLSTIYSIIPKERGYFRFPPLGLTLMEARGLFTREMSLHPGTEIFVRAAKKDIAMAHLMSRRKQFEITGPAHRRHTRTYISDFKSVRDYMPGDRFRDIDWKAVSRLTKLMTKEFEHETSLPTMIMVDCSISMREVVRQRAKLDHALALAMQIGIVMHNNGHPVGLITFDEFKVMDHLTPGKCELDDIVLSLFKLPNPVETADYPGMPRRYKGGKAEGEERFLDTVGPFLVKGKRRSFTRDRTSGIFEAIRTMELLEETGMLLVVISDLETNRPAIMRSLQMAVKRKHRVVVVSPSSWPYHIRDTELSEKRLERMYEDYLEKQTLLRSLRAGGVRVIEVDPEERGELVISGLRRLSQ
ncbi:MAG TPA: DUF58 domain-containing protein [Euryarchaeota archaeon]|nr:MAG: hypothetical protein B6U90_02285 [Thermoplasmatales archaeon ex4484_6]RLF68172.1 MAG: hypothetical protein DRN57_04720 [Thermoplasmata archaeon]HHD16829.1 DUF58 domain-containing protein [Euryarchaeota archaeon]